ncbi:hypothetical protein NVV95_17205 [Herbiconiux sp. CPCC 205716]|uniref:RNA polymerase sigma-70 region 2 domain-containing protein n=1 Tax=Herbiconiux gentiana TaxID=2970912 RepID=A0ABT2GJB2_9MICO|nr:sigma factor [Herbiconiux gentiana]MCS5716287.1 hypothetical protein [Herbiconiux gentiana]
MIPHRSPEQSSPLETLLARTADGDTDAFAELYDRTAPRVLGFIRQFVADPQQAEAVCLDVFVNAWHRSAHFDPRHGSALAWILQDAHVRAAGTAGTDHEIALSA